MMAKGKGKEPEPAPGEDSEHGNVETAETAEDWRNKLCRSVEIYKPILDYVEQMVVMFVASWCVRSREMYPQFVEISKKYSSGMYFVRMDVEVLPDVSAQWGVRRVPAFVFIRSGRQIDEVQGPNKEEVDRKTSLYALPPPAPEKDKK